MIGVMGLGASALSSPFGVLFGGIDEDEAMEEFDDIRRRLRLCEVDYTRYQREKDVVPAKLNHMKGAMDIDNKMYPMISVLESEWHTIHRRMQEFQDRQSSSSFEHIGYSGW